MQTVNGQNSIETTELDTTSMKPNQPKVIRQITVGIGLTVHRSRVLLRRRSAPSIPEYHNHWELPGGKIEPGECVESAIEREVLEETGYHVACSKLLPFSFSRTIGSSDGDQSHVIVIGSVCDLSSSVQEDRYGADALQKFHWFPINKVPLQEVIPGSREFILWWLHSNRITRQSPPYRIVLYNKSHGGSESGRRYDLYLKYQPRSADPFQVTRRWWLKDESSASTSKIDTYRRMEDAIRMLQHTLSKRQVDGYEMMFVEQNHPLRSWLKEVGMAHEVSKPESPCVKA